MLRIGTPTGPGGRSLGIVAGSMPAGGQTAPRPDRAPVTAPTTTTVMIAPIVATTIELMSSGPSIGFAVEEDAGEESANERADDAEHDVPDDAEALVTLDEEAGEVACNRAEHEPRNDAHQNLHPLFRLRVSPRAGHGCTLTVAQYRPSNAGGDSRINGLTARASERGTDREVQFHPHAEPPGHPW